MARYHAQTQLPVRCSGCRTVLTGTPADSPEAPNLCWQCLQESRPKPLPRPEEER